MPPGKHHQVANLKSTLGELCFEARIGDRTQPVWLRTDTPVLPPADAALAACLIPAMRSGGRLEMSDPVSPRVLRTQREFQAIQRAWSLDWHLNQEPLREVEVLAPARPPGAWPQGRVAAFFSGGVDSWATLLANPDVTDLIFVRGLDLIPGEARHLKLADEVEKRLRGAATALGLPLHVVETNLRELSDPVVRWEAYNACAIVAVALFFEPLFERVLIASDTDHATQVPLGTGRMIDQLWSTELLEIVDDGGRFNREQRIRQIVDHPVVQQTLRVCWENPNGVYNCGRCRKCLLTMVPLEAIGTRRQVTSFPVDLDLDLLAGFEIDSPIALALWEDVLDTTRTASRADLERAVEPLVATGKRALGLSSSYRGRRTPGTAATIRIAVVIPAWHQPQYLAASVQSALNQEIATGVGVVIVNDGCPDPETDRIGQALRDAHPDRVAYLRQPNSGLSAARNAGIRQALTRWPHIEAIFPLDADNMLSPHTLAKLSELLEARPEAAWASPALEFFGAENGEWQIPGPYLPYRQLLANQCDAGSLIRRQVFVAGIEFDESMRDGFEDWEFFLHATLAGFRGVLAGRCGFRYRRRQGSMLTKALRQADSIEAEIRRRHPEAYEPAALIEREHAEAPRFALVRCDRRDVLLTASCTLEPRQLSLAEFARSIAASGSAEPSLGDHIPAVTVLTSSAAVDQLEAEDLMATALFRLQGGLRNQAAVGLQVGGGAEAGLAAVAVRASALLLLSGGARPALGGLVEIGSAAPVRSEPLPERSLAAAAAVIAAAVQGEGMPLAENSHSRFLEHHHIDLMQTTFQSSDPAARGHGRR
jgi:hypothetical protein